MSKVRLEAVRSHEIAPEAAQGIPMQPASADIWDKKYRLKTKKGEPVDATIDDTYKRVARALADAETTAEKQAYWYERFLWALRKGAIPAGRITSNAGALELCVPPDADLRITAPEQFTFATNLDSQGLRQSDDTWTRTGSGARIDLRVEGNAASFTLDPEEGCR